MTPPSLEGYRGPARAVLERFNVGVWDDVGVECTGGRFHGLILPRSEVADDRHVVLKLSSGYNFGVRASKITHVTRLGHRDVQYRIAEKQFPINASRPQVLLLGTGGTIASRLDYRTGAVVPAFSPGELYSSVPELAELCNLRTENLFSVFSENIGPQHYIPLARRIADEIAAGVDGIVIGHGTDTMHHTAALLTFMVQNPPVPIVMVGSQRSADRPSSDAAVNLINAVRTAATGNIAEVLVCMLGPTSDEYGLLHRGTRVRKMHSSYRSTFRTIGDIPVALVDPGGIRFLRDDYPRRRRDRHCTLNTAFEERVTLLYCYPNMQPDMVDALVERGYRGIVLAGTGLGHVNRPLHPALRRAAERGVHLYMTTQTLWGFVNMYVYETGRELMDLGVVPLGNMLPEVAYMKLCWTLGQTDDREQARRIMLSRVCDEITNREPYHGYLVFQGAIPEVQEFLRKVKR